MSTEPLMVGDWAWEQEDYGYLQNLPESPVRGPAWEAFKRPPEVNINWHRTENQGRIGSCQGHALSSVLERLAFVRGENVQLSEIFAYLGSQKIDGLLGGDRGSTVSGGCKLAVEFGCTPEARTGYPTSYPGRAERDKILSAENYAAAAPYKAKSSWRVPDDYDALLDFIGGGGGVNFGIKYGSGMIPKDRIVRSYSPGMGGHAMCILGYDKDGNLRAANSHGDGGYLIMPKAWQQIMSHRYTAAIGLMGNAGGQPVDWYQNSPYYKLQERPHE